MFTKDDSKIKMSKKWLQTVDRSEKVGNAFRFFALN